MDLRECVVAFLGTLVAVGGFLAGAAAGWLWTTVRGWTRRPNPYGAIRRSRL